MTEFEPSISKKICRENKKYTVRKDENVATFEKTSTFDCNAKNPISISSSNDVLSLACKNTDSELSYS